MWSMSSRCSGFNSCNIQAWWLWLQGLVAPRHGGILLDKRLNPCPLYWQAIFNHWTTREFSPSISFEHTLGPRDLQSPCSSLFADDVVMSVVVSACMNVELYRKKGLASCWPLPYHRQTCSLSLPPDLSIPECVYDHSGSFPCLPPQLNH